MDLKEIKDLLFQYTAFIAVQDYRDLKLEKPEIGFIESKVYYLEDEISIPIENLRTMHARTKLRTQLRKLIPDIPAGYTAVSALPDNYYDGKILSLNAKTRDEIPYTLIATDFLFDKYRRRYFKFKIIIAYAKVTNIKEFLSNDDLEKEKKEVQKIGRIYSPRPKRDDVRTRLGVRTSKSIKSYQ